jgi:hypothetical protein
LGNAWELKAKFNRRLLANGMLFVTFIMNQIL